MAKFKARARWRFERRLRVLSQSVGAIHEAYALVTEVRDPALWLGQREFIGDTSLSAVDRGESRYGSDASGEPPRAGKV